MTTDGDSAQKEERVKILGKKFSKKKKQKSEEEQQKEYEDMMSQKSKTKKKAPKTKQKEPTQKPTQNKPKGIGGKVEGVKDVRHQYYPDSVLLLTGHNECTYIDTWNTIFL